MATKKFIIEVEEGMTLCKDCPYKIENAACNCPFRMKVSQCRKYNLATMKTEDYNENEIKKDIIDKAAEWIKTHWREYINGPNKDGCISFGHWENDFKKAMEE